MNRCVVTASAFFIRGIIATLIVFPAHATLKFYYDPATGNVSFDTTGTSSGELLTYGLYMRVTGISNPPVYPPDIQTIRFRNENLVRLSNTTFFQNDPLAISDQSIGNPAQGLFTLGDILPAGLDEETWSRLFARSAWGEFHDPSIAGGWWGQHTYTAEIGNLNPAAEFFYGRPEGEFDNRWDLVDPDTLQWASQATLTYDPATGEVVLDTTGPDSGHITTFWLKSTDPRFLLGNALEIPGMNLFPSVQNDLVYRGDALEPGVYSLGDILDTAISAEDIDTLFERRQFLAREGFNQASFDFEQYGLSMSVVYLPEPVASGLFVGLLTLGHGTKMRRRSFT